MVLILVLGLKLDVSRISLEQLRKEKENSKDPSMTLEFDICEAEGLIQPSESARVIRPEGALRVEEFLKKWWS